MLEFILVLVIVVLLAFPLGKYLACIMQNREMKIDPIFNWIEKQSYIVLGNLMYAAALENIDTCPMEGFNQDLIEKILNIYAELILNEISISQSSML